ncbi:MAG TPA: M48 family metalloprotease, partial [Candidatus Polarisedimenticolia bacterium]|nr:M48 family metalloprotease [Candidatus Polarisedimenticolia bacterium]
MRHSLLSRCTAIFLIASFTLSCATTKVPPISATGSGFTPERDEVKLWEQARAEEKKLRAEAKIYNDPLLEDYLDGVVTTLNPKKMAANEKIDYHVTVIEDPTLNAFAYPHGSLYVHTGLLARMENEDQLATVLGHEMTHVENRHMLRYQRSARNKQIAAFAGAVAGSIILEKQAADASRSGHTGRAAATRVLSGVMLGLGLQLGLLAAVNGYGRDLEREADVGGFEKMSSVGYDLREAPKVYEALLDDHGDPSKAEAFFFGNHPRLTERIDTAKEWRKTHPQAAAAPGGAADRDPEQFQKRVRGVVRDDA